MYSVVGGQFVEDKPLLFWLSNPTTDYCTCNVLGICHRIELLQSL